jgi:hypothetical protein
MDSTPRTLNTPSAQNINNSISEMLKFRKAEKLKGSDHFQDLSVSEFQNLSLSEQLASEVLSLPIGPHVPETAPDLVAKAIRSF